MKKKLPEKSILKKTPGHYNCYLIAPVRKSKKFYLYNLETQKRYQRTASFTFSDCGMGFIHLHDSLILCGGQKQGDQINDAYRVYCNGQTSFLPSMNKKKSFFPLAELNSGKTIVSVGGYYLKKSISVCERLQSFKKWAILPKTNIKLSRRSACGVAPSIIFSFGGFPNISKTRAQYLAMDNLNQGWKELNFKQYAKWPRYDDGCCYLPEQQKIIVFGNSNGEKFTSQFRLNKEHWVDHIAITKKLFDDKKSYEYCKICPYREYRGILYTAVSDCDQCLFAYKDKSWHRINWIDQTYQLIKE